MLAGMSNEFIQAQTSVGSQGSARELAREIVEAELAACVQVVGPVASTYRWEGEIESAEEWLLLMKTTTALSEPLQTFIGERHSCEVPELIMTPIVAGSSDYLDWLRAQVRPC